ncbi:hypothetical protein [Sedimentitalea todarodis]|uniref:DUF304 domain-containing protein n=1 Tax=Sedimentitalea todarodis TaxID=1631240 RepID=A0ABU3VBG2_9RHOB|nr:hypothetical protein [Sedimentitalea todarodis]MDU9003518.1 hypothetical protein [Sedimentitalea todarodis]
MQTDVIAVVEASAFRRWMAVATLGGVAVLLIYSGATTGTSAILRTCAIVLGVFSLVIALRLYQATLHRIELTSEGLRDSSGVSIARLDEILSMDRGFLAFKPSNGFVVRTHVPTVKTWRPGLWWRFGRHVGVGGVIPAHQARFMADRLAEQLAARR